MNPFDKTNGSVLGRRAVIKGLGSLTAFRGAATVQSFAESRLTEEGAPLVPASGEGPEQAALRDRVGLWNVTETTWDHPGEKPTVQTGAIAERQMVGPILQEFLRVPPYIANGKVSRIDYLRFNSISFQWEYVSLETRADVGLMPAKSFTRVGPDRGLELVHDPFVIRVNGGDTPVLLRMKSIITYKNVDEDTKDQYFATTDGSGLIWLAHQYSYRRRR